MHVLRTHLAWVGGGMTALASVLVALAKTWFLICVFYMVAMGLYVVQRVRKGKAAELWPDGQIDRAPASGVDQPF